MAMFAAGAVNMWFWLSGRHERLAGQDNAAWLMLSGEMSGNLGMVTPNIADESHEESL